MNFWKLLWKYDYLILLVIAIIYWNFFRDMRPQIQGVRDFDLMGAVIIFAWLAGTAYLDKMQNRTPKIISGHTFNSLGCPPYPFRSNNIEMFLFREGGTKSRFVSTLGNDGVTICPVSWATNHHDSWTVHSHNVEVPLSDLPIEAQEHIKSMNLDPPYKLAISPHLDDFSPIPGESIIAQLYNAISSMNKVIHWKFGIVRDFNDEGGNAANTYNREKRGFVDGVRDFVRRREE